MKKKEGILVVVILLLLVIGIGIFLFYNNSKSKNENNEIKNEYTPQEEVTEEQLQNTIISLYFINKETKEINPEARTIKVNSLIENPYKYLIEQLIEGPKNEKLEKGIPENTKLNNVELRGDILYIDFSKELIENAKKGQKNEEKIIETIVKTVTELNEVNYIKILIDGKENEAFNDKEVTFENTFPID